jgi:hypothetical protein
MKSPQIVYRHETNNNSLQPLNLDYHLGGAHQHISTLVAMDSQNLVMANNLHTIGASKVVSGVGDDHELLISVLLERYMPHSAPPHFMHTSSKTQNCWTIFLPTE